MLTDAKLEANRQNAQKSTGPKTEEGKIRSSRNALKSGLHSMSKLLPGEDERELATLTTGMLNDFNPLDTTETELVNQLIDIQWRLRRAGDYEARILSEDLPDFNALNKMSLHAARLKRQFTSTLKEFEDRHKIKAKDRNKEFAQAAKIHEADRILNRPSRLSELGFDFTPAYFDRCNARAEALEEAEEVIDDYKDQQDEEALEEMEADDLGFAFVKDDRPRKAA